MRPLYAPQRVPSEQCLIVLFELRCPEAEQRLRRELAGWGCFTRSEGLIDSFVELVIRPGGAAR
jgi:hypothetical protein